VQGHGRRIAAHDDGERKEDLELVMVDDALCCARPVFCPLAHRRAVQFKASLADRRLSTCNPMYPDSGKETHHQRAIEFLARESQAPVSEVAQLYETARAELEVGARIRSFVGIFALRKVRKALRARGFG
jgi:hypothetical protein